MGGKFCLRVPYYNFQTQKLKQGLAGNNCLMFPFPSGEEALHEYLRTKAVTVEY